MLQRDNTDSVWEARPARCAWETCRQPRVAEKRLQVRSVGRRRPQQRCPEEHGFHSGNPGVWQPGRGQVEVFKGGFQAEQCPRGSCFSLQLWDLKGLEPAFSTFLTGPYRWPSGPSVTSPVVTQELLAWSVHPHPS